MAEKYGVWGEKMNYGRKYMGIIRSAFVINEQGKIAGAFYKVSPKDTVPKVTADARRRVSHAAASERSESSCCASERTAATQVSCAAASERVVRRRWRGSRRRRG